jgi:cytochrome d ubiquinol oxidase subunit I
MLMDNLTAARGQMELSLGFPMILAASGIGIPLLMLMAEGPWLRTRLLRYRELARMWEGQRFALRPRYSFGNRPVF